MIRPILACENPYKTAEEFIATGWKIDFSQPPEIGDPLVGISLYDNSDYWKDSSDVQAVYLHKFCVRREYAHRNMTKTVIEVIKEECRKNGIKYIRLDTGLDEKVVRKIYLNAGFKIVDIIDYDNGRSMALYELEV